MPRNTNLPPMSEHDIARLHDHRRRYLEAEGLNWEGEADDHLSAFLLWLEKDRKLYEAELAAEAEGGDS